MDTVEECSDNLSFDDQIKIINDLEQYIFKKIYSRLEFRSKIHNQIKLDHLNLVKLNYTIFDKSLLCQSFYQVQAATPLNFFKPIHDKILKTVIYILHDQGMFKESDENRVKRLCRDTVKKTISCSKDNDEFPCEICKHKDKVLCKKGDDIAEKLDFEYLPIHYHEIISDIKTYRSAIETKNHTQAKIIYKSLLQQYSKHRDSYVIELLPESFQNTIDKIQISYLSQEPYDIKEKAYIDFVEEFIKKFEYDHVLLWNELNFSRQDQNTLKEISALSFQLIGPFKNKFAIRKLNSKIRALKPKKIVLLEKLTEYLDKKATAYVREILMQMYDQKEKIYTKQQGNIDKLLRTNFKKYQTKILNRKQQVKIISKIKTKFTPQIIQILEDKQEKKQQQLDFKVQLQKHIVRNLTNASTGIISSESVYDPYLFTPTASIHDTNALAELKTKATRNKSAKKQKGFQNQEHPTTQPKRKFIGDTERMLKDNKKIYQSLKDLLND
ncbi:hypothetical protein [Acinetobacter sp. YH12255]|uniref:hypothetical protein n=1 Tax=Acinetobacter sp. YH12255 TaxID=2601179 RepID=UPI0015D31F91|nr:hypothetical protein [Acinetobacter sp. YH12255]